MSNQLAMLQLYIACQSIVPENPICTNLTEDIETTSKRHAMVQLYLACQSLVPKMSTCTDVNDAELTKVTQMPLKLSKSTIDLPEGYTKFPDIGLAYKMYAFPMSWDNARKQCAREGANLAVIDSTMKLENARGLNVFNNSQVWAGLHRFFDIAEWVEVKTGLPPASILWGRIPDVYDFNKCAVLSWTGRYLKTSTCFNEGYQFICEIPI